jgi:transposase
LLKALAPKTEGADRGRRRSSSRPPIRVFSQDESRIGLMPIRRRRLTLRGVKPVGPVQYRFESYYLYGAVEPTTGRSFFLELPRLDAACFQIFVDHFAAQHADSVNLVVLDNGACHTAKRLRLPPNLVFVPLPPYSPELNPIERLWRDLKDHLAFSLYKGLPALKGRVTQLLRRYTPLTLRSLTGYPYFVKAVNGLLQ